MQKRTLTSYLRDTALDSAYVSAIWGRRIWRYITRPTEVGIRMLVIRGDTILLVRHRSGSTPWSLPGGGIKTNETCEAAAHREVREEAGCLIEIERLHGIFHSTGRGLNIYTIVFVCTGLADAYPPVGDIEIADARFVPLRAIGVDAEAGTCRRISEYLDDQVGLTGEW